MTSKTKLSIPAKHQLAPASLPEQRQGMVILLSLFVIALIGIGFIYIVASTFWLRNLMFVELSFVTGLCIFFAIWFALSPDSLLYRSIQVCLAIAASVSALYLGILLCIPIDESLARSRDVQLIYLTGLIAPIFLGATLPLLVLRYGFGRQLVSARRLPLGQQKMTVGGLLVVTALVGVVLGGIQVATFPFADAEQPFNEDVKQIWISAGIGAATLFAIALLGAIPAVLLLLNEKLPFWPYFFLYALWAILWIVVVYFLSLLFRFGDEASIGFMVSTGLFALILATSCGALRRMGYRLKN